jgi:hypothetical protein
MKKLIHLIILSFVFTSISYSQTQFENGGFEVWEDVGLGADKMEPVNWSSIKTSDNSGLNTVAPVVWGVSDDAHSGSYSVYLHNVATLGIVATGTLTNGRVHPSLFPDSAWVYTDVNDPNWHSTMTWRPDSVAGWYKSNAAEGDFGTVKVALHKGSLQLPGDETNIVGIAYYEMPPGTVSNWTRFSVPIQYTSSDNPDYQLTVLTAGNGVDAFDGSEIWFDDIEFIYNNSSVEDHLTDNFMVFAFDGKINISVTNTSNDNYGLYVRDIMGRDLYSTKNYKGQSLSISEHLKSGIYFVTLIKGNQRISRKVMLK